MLSYVTLNTFFLHNNNNNISRHSRHKRNRFSVSAAVRGFTMGKCGLLPQHFHHRINVTVVILLFFNVFCLCVCACGL